MTNSTEGREMPRIPISDFPEVQAEITAALGDQSRVDAMGVHRKTLTRILNEGLPKQFEPFVKDAALLRALIVGVERRAA